MKDVEADRSAAAAYIADFLPELSQLARFAGHDVLSYLLQMAYAEAKELSSKGLSD